ncbi:MAG: hypothetical protein K2Y01_07625 [Rhabdochlamydiaceae bacterium]|nr:hypothetical protein [Rhabdochlamydiaceae bacterium]
MQLANVQIPGGLQTYVFGLDGHNCVFLSGRTNGLHGFNFGNDNFPPLEQNTNVYVLDLKTSEVYVKSLADPSSGLSQSEIDSLSVTAAQFFQSNKTLYMNGGYGVDTNTGTFGTKPILSAIDIPGLIHWVKKPSKKETAKQHIRQISHPIFQVTGGALYQSNPHAPFLLMFGQNFDGFYSAFSNGVYTQQVRSFRLIDDGYALAVFAEKYNQPNPNYRRRDLNVVPIIQAKGNSYEESFLALSGVFTLDGGVWTVPVFINAFGDSFMPDPLDENTFKQGMNNYNSARLGLFSKKTGEMHTLLLGGISYEFPLNGEFLFDAEMPFDNSVTDVVIDKNGNIAQYLMANSYPFILSIFGSLPGGPLLFGAGARFVPAGNLPNFSQRVFSLDSLKQRTLLGYVVGGIMSTLPDTQFATDSAASPYIFEVYATPR